jgi:hypothetical protein
MPPDISWITPLYGFQAGLSHIAVRESARASLQEMADELSAKPGLVAIYIPEGTDEVYKAGGKRGHVVGAVQLTEMPAGRKMEDYFYNDWDGSPRWPIGWPCKVVYAPNDSASPQLREYVETLFGLGSFGGYVKRFQIGPFRLEPAIRQIIDRDFAQFERID